MRFAIALGLSVLPCLGAAGPLLAQAPGERVVSPFALAPVNRVARSAPSLTLPAVPIHVGDTVNGHLQARDHVAVYTLELCATTAERLAVAIAMEDPHSDFFSPLWELYDPDGVRLFGSNSLANVSLTGHPPGVYEIRVSDANADGTGAFSLSAQGTTTHLSSGLPLRSGEKVDGQLASRAAMRTHGVMARPGETLRIQITNILGPGYGSWDPFWDLFSPSGIWIAGAFGSQLVTIPAAGEPGLHTLLVTDRFLDGTGEYRIEAWGQTGSPGYSTWHDFFAVDPRETPLTGDFDGDGRTDILTLTRDNPLAMGDVYAALSLGDRFGPNLKWHDWFAIDSGETVVAGDYDGDGRDDLATWLPATRQVYVATSHGTGLGAERVWLDRIGFDAGDVLLAGDADGDRLSDLVLFNRARGKVFVARSGGSSFADPVPWHSFFAVSTRERPRVGDLDGDGRSDILTFGTDSPTAYGDVYVARSTGSSFADGWRAEKWHDFFSIDPAQGIAVGDLDGDGRDDFFTFLPPPQAQVYAVLSEGTGLGPNRLLRQDIRQCASDLPFVGDADGDGKADIIVFRQGEGRVKVVLAP